MLTKQIYALNNTHYFKMYELYTGRAYYYSRQQPIVYIDKSKNELFIYVYDSKLDYTDKHSGNYFSQWKQKCKDGEIEPFKDW